MYIRFVVGSDDDHHKNLAGIFSWSYRLIEEGKLLPYEEELLNETYDWFNTYLPCPPFEECLQKKIWPASAVSYYKDDAEEAIAKMRIMAHLLNEHGQNVRVIRSDNPGKVLYEDDFQIVVEQLKHMPKRKANP